MRTTLAVIAIVTLFAGCTTQRTTLEQRASYRASDEERDCLHHETLTGCEFPDVG